MNCILKFLAPAIRISKCVIRNFFIMFLAIHIPDIAVDAHTALLECASVFSPRVEHEGANTVVLDVHGLERMFGSYSEIANQVVGHVRTAGFEPSIAIANNPDAAALAARG